MKETFSTSPSASRTAGLNTSKTTNANNTTASIPLFRFTGTVRVLRLYGVVTTVLGATHTLAHFRFNDQTAQPTLTLAAGLTASAAPVGSLIAKMGLAAAVAVLNTSAAGRVIEPVLLGDEVMPAFLIVAKPGANSDIEYRYTTVDAPTSGQIQFFLEYQPLSADGSVTAL